jgi:hypothetical protein
MSAREKITMKPLQKKQWSGWLALLAMAILLQAPAGAAAEDQPYPQNQNVDQGTMQNPADAPQAGASQDNDSQPPAQDPPSRVARLNYMEGSVSFQPGGENDWVDGVLNRPLVTGDNLWADENSRAEVHIGSTALRLGDKTGITLLEVSDRVAQIRLAQGALLVRVRHVDDEDSYEIDTPNIAFAITQPGEYRLDVSADGNRTDVTVFHGRGEATGGGSSYTVVADQHASFTGTDQLDYELGQIPREDGFEQWAFDRDDREDHADSANYVSREMTGYEDLDDNGDWTYVAGYGTCWRPRAVVAGWAPYRFGHWAWVGPWGWTWVEDEPWGFAPFHYGRWAFAGSGWFWVPGPVMVRPIYAPALVAWVGGASFSFGAGVGWFPLAPGEVFVPGYRVSRYYVNQVNITNTRVDVTRVTNVYNDVVVNRNINRIAYVNRNVNGGVTVVSRDTFVNARPVARNIQTVSAREIQSAAIARRADVEPVRQSSLGAGRPVAVRPPVAVMTRQVVARRTPAPMPASFEQRQAAAGGRLNQQVLVRPQPPARAANTNQPRAQDQSEEGFRPFGQNSSGQNNGGSQRDPFNREPTPQRIQPAPEQNRTPAEAYRPSQENQRSAQPSEPAWSHPLARPVQPPQERPQQEQQNEQKFNRWQQQRPAPQERPQARPEPRSESRPSAPEKKR